MAATLSDTLERFNELRYSLSNEAVEERRALLIQELPRLFLLEGYQFEWLPEGTDHKFPYNTFWLPFSHRELFNWLVKVFDGPIVGKNEGNPNKILCLIRDDLVYYKAELQREDQPLGVILYG